MRINPIVCSSISYSKSSMIKNNNMAFGAYFSHGTTVWEKADWEALERMGKTFGKLASGVLDPKRKVP